MLWCLGGCSACICECLSNQITDPSTSCAEPAWLVCLLKLSSTCTQLQLYSAIAELPCSAFLGFGAAVAEQRHGFEVPHSAKLWLQMGCLGILRLAQHLKMRQQRAEVRPTRMLCGWQG